MTNFDFTRLDQLKDVESFNIDKLMRGMHIPRALRWRWIRESSRDNARTPMQWTDGPGAGFTTGEPWLGINGNYRTLNYAAQEADPDSVLHYYRRMVALRAGSETLKYGAFTPLFGNRRVMAYQRTLREERIAVALNFSGRPAKAALQGEVIASNIGTTEYRGVLAPWEAVVLRMPAQEVKA